MIPKFQDIPTFTSLKSHLLSLIPPKIKSTFGIHDALGLRYLFQLRVNLSPLGILRLYLNAPFMQLRE